jgi:hypothetical protein
MVYHAPLVLADTSLIFGILSHVSFNDKTAYRNVSVSGEEVIQGFQGSAEVSQSSAVYVFTGYDSPEPGMGMDSIIIVHLLLLLFATVFKSTLSYPYATFPSHFQSSLLV